MTDEGKIATIGDGKEMSGKECRTMDIGQKILEIRKAEGLSQTEFAEKFHVTRQTVSNWENGRNYPDMETLLRISDEYDITFDELVKSDKELMRSIDRSRRVATKSVMIFALIGIVIVTMVLIKLLPSAVSAFYYDPLETAATYTSDDRGRVDVPRLEMDSRIYSELYLPEYKYEISDAVPLGYGKYDFELSESGWIEPHTEHRVTGRIERNHIQIYNQSEFRMPASDVFMRDTSDMMDPDKEMEDHLDTLSSNERYTAYITLKEDTDYEQACKWIDQYGTGYPWACIVTGNDEFMHVMGVYTDYIGIDAPFDQEKYPYLLGYREYHMEDPYEDPPYVEEYAKKHFISMMQYQIDNPAFLKMVWRDTNGARGEPLKEWMGSKIQHVENNGMKVYGFAVDATRETLREIAKSGKVCRIVTE